MGRSAYAPANTARGDLTESGHPAGAVAFIKAGAADYVSAAALATTLAALAPAPPAMSPP